MSETSQLQLLKTEVQRFRIESERYFNGAVAIPPEQLAQDIREAIRDIYSVGELDTPEQFRLNGIVARFNALDERFNRRFREHETGSRPPQSPPPTVEKPDLEHGIVVDEYSSADTSHTLFDHIYSNQPAEKADAFHHYLQRRAAEIRAKTGCSQVRFRVQTTNGHRKLVARPVVDSS